MLHGYLTWCHACGWNLAAPPAPLPRTRFERLAARAGRTEGERLAAELSAADRLEPRLTPGRAASYAIAGLIHVLAVGLVLGGAALAVLAFPNVFALAFGALMIASGILMRPRLGRAPDEDVVRRESAPELYSLVDEVAAALETKTIDLLVINDAYNASWSVVGLRRCRVLSLGLPLFAALEPQERVALIAHELAHARNGDSTRGFLVGSSLNGLATLYSLLAPKEADEVDPDFAIVDQLVSAVMWVVSRPIYGVLLLQLHLLLRDSRRAEFYADDLAARVAGARSIVGLHEKLLLGSALHGIVQARAQAQGDADVFLELEDSLRSLPERERERRRRVARLEHSRLGDTHPPTAHRIDVLEARPSREPLVTLEPARTAAIEEELRPHRIGMQRRLIDAYRDSLYD